MGELSKDYRWNVLTVLILYANIRNRAWVTTDTMVKLAANGNRSKAFEAKEWLIAHKAIELVPYEQRIGDEAQLPPRQNIYQLTGCIELEDHRYHYLYVGEMESPVGHSVGADTFESSDNETFKSLDVQTLSSEPTDGVDSFKDSFKDPNTKDPKEIQESAPSAKVSAPPEPPPTKSAKKKSERSPAENLAITSLIKAWLFSAEVVDSTAYRKKGFRDKAWDLHCAGITPQDIANFIRDKRATQKKGAIWLSTVTNEIVAWKHHYQVPATNGSGHAPPAAKSEPERVEDSEAQARSKNPEWQARYRRSLELLKTPEGRQQLADEGAILRAEWTAQVTK
jgi:hypothetical protein